MPFEQELYELPIQMLSPEQIDELLELCGKYRTIRSGASRTVFFTEGGEVVVKVPALVHPAEVEEDGDYLSYGADTLSTLALSAALKEREVTHYKPVGEHDNKREAELSPQCPERLAKCSLVEGTYNVQLEMEQVVMGFAQDAPVWACYLEDGAQGGTRSGDDLDDRWLCVDYANEALSWLRNGLKETA